MIKKLSLLGAIWFAGVTLALANPPMFKTEVLAEQLDFPWSLAFLPNGDYLVSFLGGQLRTISAATGGLSTPIANTPATYRKSQGGYFDVVLDPDFENNQKLYLAFAKGTADDNATAVISARLIDHALQEVETIFSVKNRKDTPVHYGGRLLFLRDGTLLLTTGDGFDYREAAQDPFSQLGKTLRFNTDGSVPADNPFADGQQADPYVYSLGHRSPQGLATDSENGAVYLHEHGPKGGDEVNLISAGANYGWPVTTYGINYTGAKVTPFTTRPGIKPPLVNWTPSIAPSGLTVYRGTAFAAWNGYLFVGGLVTRGLHLLKMNAGKVEGETTISADIEQRVRDVRTGPDGFIYILTETKEGAGGRLLRLVPAAQ